MLPVLADVGLSVLAAHCLDINLRVAAEHLDTQVELQDAGAGKVILQRVLQASDERREQVLLRLAQKEQVVAQMLRRGGHLVCKQRDGPAQNYVCRELAQRCALEVAAEPGGKVLEVALGILHGRAAQNPLAPTAESHERAKAARLGSVADRVTLIENDAVPHGLLDHLLRAPEAVIGRDKDGGVRVARPRALEQLAESDLTLGQRGGPLRGEHRRAHEKCAVDRSILEKPDTLPRLAETHVVREDAATAVLSIVALAIQHPAHALLLVREEREAAVALLESHFFDGYTRG